MNRKIHLQKFSSAVASKVKEKFFDMDEAKAYPQSETVAEIEKYVDHIVNQKNNLSGADCKMVREMVADETLGFGPLGPLLRMPAAGSIWVLSHEQAVVEMFHYGRRKVKKVAIRFDDDEHFRRVITRITGPLCGVLSSDMPILSATMPNGAKIFASCWPASSSGCTLSIIQPDGVAV